MAYTDKDIVITPNKGSETERPTIKLTDGLIASSSTISLGVETIGERAAFTVDGIAGRLLTIVDSFTGTIFAVTDETGIPIIDVTDTGTVTIGKYKGILQVNTTATIDKLVTGNISTTTTIEFITSSTTKFQIGTDGQWGIGGPNYGAQGSFFVSGGASSPPSWSNSLGNSTTTATLVGSPVILDGSVSFTKNYTETVGNPVITSNILTLDLSTAGTFEVNVNANINTMNITNPAPVGKVSTIIIIFNYQATTYTVTWPVSFRWSGGSAPILTNTDGKRDIFTAFTTDGGTTYNAFVSGLNL